MSLSLFQLIFAESENQTDFVATRDIADGLGAARIDADMGSDGNGGQLMFNDAL